MTYVEFCLRAGGVPHGQRRGQWAFNLLQQERPELAAQVRANPFLDPFYVEENLDSFYRFLREHW